MNINKLFLSVVMIFYVVLTGCSEQDINVNKVSSKSVSDESNIEKILEEYIQTNPEIIRKAQVSFEKIVQKKRISENNGLLLYNTDDYSIGPDNAKVTVVEFFDYNCPFCKKSASFIANLPKKHAGKVRVVFKEYPVLSYESELATIAALAAGRQGKYHEMHQALMKSNNELVAQELERIAKSIGLDMPRWTKDRHDERLYQQIEDVEHLADKLKINAIPTFVINNQIIVGGDKQHLIDVISKNLE